jgi:glucose-1-phosphate thymidylyltransferase
MKGIILHGGKGTHLRPLTHTGPKQLIPIANKPMSQYALEDLKEAGINDIAIILGDIAPERVSEYYGHGEKFGVRITYINQGEAKGIAHAVGLVKEFVREEPFAVYLGDNLLRDGIRELAEDFSDSTAAAQIALCHVPDPTAFGVAVLDATGRVVSLVEKPKVPPSDLALVGVYMFRKSIFDAIDHLKPSWRGELEITEAIQELVNVGHEVRSKIVSGWWKDTGKPEDILEANQLVLSELESSNRGKVENESVITGNVSIDEETTIRRGCNIRGPVIIGKNCSIGPGTYVGPYTSIGNNVVIEGGEIENSIVVSDSMIKCSKRIVDSLIGKGSTIVSAEMNLPKGYKVVIGENTFISI